MEIVAQTNDPYPQTDRTVAAAKQAQADGRAAIGLCRDCGVPERLHRGVTGLRLDCDVAAYVRRVSDRPTNPARWNDPHADLTALVEAAMVNGTCGPRFEIEMAGYTRHERLDIAAMLVRIAVGGYLAQLALRGESRSFIHFRLPDGRTVPVDATAAKEAQTITFTLKDGTIVDAVRVTEGGR